MKLREEEAEGQEAVLIKAQGLHIFLLTVNKNRKLITIKKYHEANKKNSI